MMYQIYFVTRDYREEIDSVELEANTEEDAIEEYMDGYRANNAGQDDDMLDQIDAGEAWIEAIRI